MEYQHIRMETKTMKVIQVVKTSEGAKWAFEQAKWLKENNVDIVTIIPDNNRKYCKRIY